MPAEAATDVYPDIAFEAPNDSFDVTPVDNKDKIVVKSRLRKSSTKDKQTTAEKK